jgi:flagella basal body P-ring formation protein FlgA
MISFASSSLVVVVTALSVVIPSRAVAVAPQLSQRVAEKIAEEWRVTLPELQLEWGHVPEGLGAVGDVDFRLTGGGRNGWFAVVLRPADGESVALRVRAGIADTVWVATRNVQIGSSLDVGDLGKEPRLRWGPPNSARRSSPSPGWKVRRPLFQGDVVAWPAVVPPAMVVAGEPVRIEWSRGGVHVVLTGVALNSAAEGDVVRARVPGRAKAVSGIVVAPGSAVLRVGRNP